MDLKVVRIMENTAQSNDMMRYVCFLTFEDGLFTMIMIKYIK